MSMLRSSLYENTKKTCDFSWEGGGTFPQNSYKTSWDWEATLLRRTRLGQRLARFFGTFNQIDILLLYYKNFLVWLPSLFQYTGLNQYS